MGGKYYGLLCSNASKRSYRRSKRVIIVTTGACLPSGAREKGKAVLWRCFGMRYLLFHFSLTMYLVNKPRIWTSLMNLHNILSHMPSMLVVLLHWYMYRKGTLRENKQRKQTKRYHDNNKRERKHKHLPVHAVAPSVPFLTENL